MRTFNTPAQAPAFETKYMMRPFTWPPSNHDAPTLWERAKAMFSALTTRFGSAMRVAFRRFLSSQQRRDLILHLEPAEKLVRVLMIADAITLLVMTPMGLSSARLRGLAASPTRHRRSARTSRIQTPTASRLR